MGPGFWTRSCQNQESLPFQRQADGNEAPALEDQVDGQEHAEDPQAVDRPPHGDDEAEARALLAGVRPLSELDAAISF